MCLMCATCSARLILAGDPKQLGPVILSPLAQRYGLATSAMERLIGTEPYKRSAHVGLIMITAQHMCPADGSLS